MLYFGSGVRQVGLSDGQTLYVFPDFSDPLQFYYLPNNPHAVMLEDGTPALRLFIYRENLDEVPAGGEDAVGFLTLDVDLSYPPELIEEAAKKIRMQDALPEKPRMTPIFFRSGSVKLMLLDAVTPEPGGERREDGKTSFVVKVMGAASPSLYGDNRAIFQATVSKKGAAALSGALDGVTPIGVVYSLTFAGLQPAFHVKATVKWHEVYDHFSTHENHSFLFYEEDIQKSIDKLVDSRAIVIESTTEGVGTEGAEAERESAMASIRQLIFDKFFEATFERATPAGGGIVGGLMDVSRSLLRTALSFGMGNTYQTKQVNVDELRTLDVDWTARKAVERTIYPQAHISGLLKDGTIRRDQLIKVITGADDMWRVVPVDLSVSAAWELDHLVHVKVDVAYDDPVSSAVRTFSVTLTKEAPRAVKRDWMDRRTGTKMRYRYQLGFLDSGASGTEPTLSSGDWQEHDGTIIVIHPRELYDVVDLEVAAVPGFPFDRWNAVHAMVRYRQKDGTISFAADQVLTSATVKMASHFRTLRNDGGQAEVRLRYAGAGRGTEDTGWMPMDTRQWVVDDPHSWDLTIRAIVAGDRKNIANLIVDLEYVDEDAQIRATKALEFDKENINKAQSWTVKLADPAKRRYRYRMTLVTIDGEFVQTAWIGTDAPTLPVGEVYVRRLVVELETGTLGPNVEAVEVTLAYADPGNQVAEQKLFRLGTKARAEWTVDLKDASLRDYQMTTVWKMSDGFDHKVGPSTSSATYHALAGAPPQD